jgi:ABC-type polar amino acid transport system ATPase subunit
MIEIINVEKYYSGLHVLRRVCVSVAEGEVVVLLGPSGSGKTTLLRCISDLESIDSGEIRIAGRCIGHNHRADVGMVFQHFNLFPHLSVLENVTLAPIHVRRISKSHAREEAVELLRRVCLADKMDAYPAQLSGGQQQRTAIARALAMKPKVMLFDEPTSALDSETVNELLDVLRELAKSGMTMMIATHEMAFAREVADRALFMSGGELLEQAPAERLFTEPQIKQSQARLISGTLIAAC